MKRTDLIFYIPKSKFVMKKYNTLGKSFVMERLAPIVKRYEQSQIVNVLLLTANLTDKLQKSVSFAA